MLPLAMHLPLALTAARRVLRLAYRVHGLAREDADSAIAPGPVSVLLYRDPSSFDVRVLELTESAATLLELAADPSLTLAECARQAAERTGAQLDQVWLEGFSSLLADLSARGVVLGSREPER